jgi:predicted RNA-binding protein with RPS1 domain
MLFADASDEVAAPVEEEVPTEVVAMDGVESADEAHNADRPARKELKKKRPSKGTPLSEFAVGSTVKATIKSVASYGAFCDFGATSDGLLHISRMSKEYVGDVSEVVAAGQEIEVRIVEIDPVKGQVALSLLSVEEEEEAKQAQAKSRQKSDRPRGGGRRDDSGVLNAVAAKFDPTVFVTGKVVSTVAFGAFVRVEGKQFGEEIEGAFDGLVHISALAAGRASSVTDFVNVDQEVQVRVKSIGEGKVSLSMVSVEDEEANKNSRFQAQQEQFGAKDWKESLERMTGDMPEFTNSPLIIDNRN